MWTLWTTMKPKFSVVLTRVVSWVKRRKKAVSSLFATIILIAIVLSAGLVVTVYAVTVIVKWLDGSVSSKSLAVACI